MKLQEFIDASPKDPDLPRALVLLGRTYEAGGDGPAALDTPLGRRALLGAGQCFTALKQADSAIIVYKKLLAAKSVEPELADAA